MPRIIPADSQGRYAVIGEDGAVLVYGHLELQNVPGDTGNAMRLGDITFVTEPVPQSDRLERQALDAHA